MSRFGPVKEVPCCRQVVCAGRVQIKKSEEFLVRATKRLQDHDDARAALVAEIEGQVLSQPPPYAKPPHDLGAQPQSMQQMVNMLQAERDSLRMPYHPSVLSSRTQLWRTCGVGARTQFAREFTGREFVFQCLLARNRRAWMQNAVVDADRSASD